MSVARNHHYVTQALIKKFMGKDGLIYYYDKKKNYYNHKNSTKGLFSEKDLNTTIKEDGSLDHESIEASLNKYFEQDFPKHFTVVENAIRLALEKKSNEIDLPELLKSVHYLVGLGIIGDMRFPEHREDTQNTLLGAFDQLYEYAEDNWKSQIDELRRKAAITKSAIVPDYKAIYDAVLEKWEGIIFVIYIAYDGQYFVLPDCTSSVKRDYLDDIVEFGEQKLYPPKGIAATLLPLSSKFLLAAFAQKLHPGKTHCIKVASKEEMDNLNGILYDEAYNRVVCANKEYLENFVDQMLARPIDG